MKRFIKTFTFWFVLIAISVIVLNLEKQDDMNIIMIGLNPILNILSSTKTCCDAVNSIPYLWHILSFITMTGYGVIIDGIRIRTRK